MASEPYRSLEIDTPHGLARATLSASVGSPCGLLLLGHGAGGGIESPDLLAVMETASDLGVTVARIEQPYRVAGRRAAAPAHQLDAAWLAVVAALRVLDGLGAVPLICGGRSSGARVACRTAGATGAAGVLCLAFPVHPPGKPQTSRLAELEGVSVPTLVIQGERDPFGMPPADSSRREVVVVPGTHALRSAATLAAIGDAVRRWLAPRL